MSPSAIVQKLWNSACLVELGADKYCNVLPACACPQPSRRAKPRAAGRRDDLSASALKAGAQAGGMSYGDYVEQLTYLLFLKMADEGGSPLESMVL